MTVTIETTPAWQEDDFWCEWVLWASKKGYGNDYLSKVLANAGFLVTIETRPACTGLTCGNCGDDIVQRGNRPKKYCGAKCRVAASRARNG